MVAEAILIRYSVIPLNEIKWYTCSRVESMHVLDPKSHVDSRLIVDTARSVARMDGT